LTVDECLCEVVTLKIVFDFLPDHPNLYPEWETLVVASACHGRVSYDARIVAAMRTHGITTILSFNGADFVRFSGIAVIDPRSFSSAAPPLVP
jgi:predicted nucleic acid-binding protein